MSLPALSDAQDKLAAQVERVLAAKGLGRSVALEHLLRFLLVCALEGRAPKEAEIADMVFDRSHEDVLPDASVRVYVHRLRGKLDAFYARHPEAPHLILPKGSYLLALSPQDGAPEEPAPPPQTEPALHTAKIPRRALLIALLLTGALALGWVLGRWYQPDDPRMVVRQSPLWHGVLADRHRSAIVLGDFYIFGERGEDGSINRMRREFTVNSARDLDELKAMGGDPYGRYADLGLTYLPVGIGAAVNSVAPIMANGPGEPATLVLPVSQMGGQMVQTHALVYLGYLSGLGSLRSPVFEGSRFAVGSSYDEIIDHATARHYIASSHLEGSNVPGEDFALVSSFLGLDGNRILIIAGTRDAALMAAADFVTHPATLAQLDRVAAQGGSFEALIGVPALQNVGLSARLIAATPRRNPTWTARSALSFPDEIADTARSDHAP